MLSIIKKIAIVAGVVQVASCQNEPKSGSIQNIDKAELIENAIGKKVQLIDVRTPKEFNNGHIEGAVNFNISNKVVFLEQIVALNKAEPVYLYCKMGGRSNSAAKLMQQQGFQLIYDYSGGYRDWSK